MECYLLRSTGPAPDTLHYTLGEFPSNLVWAQDQTPEQRLHLNAMTGREISLSYEDKLEWITQEDSTILVFLPLPDTGRATSPQINVDMLDTAQLPGHADVLGSRLLNPLPKQQQLHDQTQPLSHHGKSLQKSQENDLPQEEIPPSLHQIFVRTSRYVDREGEKADLHSDDARSHISRLPQRRTESPTVHHKANLPYSIRGKNT